MYCLFVVISRFGVCVFLVFPQSLPTRVWLDLAVPRVLRHCCLTLQNNMFAVFILPLMSYIQEPSDMSLV